MKAPPLYNEGARVISEGRQQAAANNSYASNLKPLNGEDSIDVVGHNPTEKEDNDDSGTYPTLNNATTKLNNDQQNVSFTLSIPIKKPRLGGKVHFLNFKKIPLRIFQITILNVFSDSYIHTTS